MNDALIVAWVGVGMSAITQVAAIAFFWGRLSSKTDSLKNTIDTHLKHTMPQAHGCPYFTPEQHQTGS